MYYQHVLVFVVLLIEGLYTLEIKSLAGEWSLKDQAGKYKDLQAGVPGGIYTDLLKNGIITDIYWRYTDKDIKWVPRTNWTYYTTFTVDEYLLNHDNINIKFEGLDTHSAVYINDVQVGSSQNMFVQYIFKIKDVLKSGENTIEVRFLNPIEVAENIAKQYIEGYIIPPECVPAEYQGECHVNQLRKMQASFSWDWGPSFPSVGIWKNVTIEAFDETVIEYVVPDVIDANTDEWTVSVDVYFSDNEKGIVEGSLITELEIEEGKISNSTKVKVERNSYGELVQLIELSLNKSQVELWWPNGYGNHKLYIITVNFTNTDGTESFVKTTRIGFRTIELVQEAIGQYLSFYFKVNGYPIFMKGANSIPLDILPEKGYDPELVRKILGTAKDSYMNMLRVWGGGVYESDVFYDIADEYGILIWQDYMFASSLYPVHQSYLDNVVEEVRHQTKRLRGHACIAVIAGNNENEINVRSNSGWTDKGNHTQYIQDYIKLTIYTIKPEVLRITHERIIFVGSSPTNGIQTDKEGYVASDPGDNRYGDIHKYQYDVDHFDSTVYPVPRFISEYGLQSYPSMDSLRTITNETGDFELKSDFMENRNHHPNGNNQIRGMVERQFNIPKEGTKNYFNTIVYYSQVVNGYGIKIATEHYRRWRSFKNEDNTEGYTMGALYWQLNDVWVAPSWAGIDYLGKWKVLHYYTREFFAPVIVTGHIYQDRQLQIHGVSDLLHDVTNASFVLEVYDWTKFEPVSSLGFEVSLEPSASQLIYETNTDDYLAKYCGDKESAKKKCFFRVALKNETGLVAPENFVLPCHVKEVYLETPDLKVTTVNLIDDTTLEITLSTDRIALFVWLNSRDIRGTFSQNAFTMYTETKTVLFNSEEVIDLDVFKKTLTVTNIRNDEFK